MLDSQEDAHAANADGDNSKTASKEGSQKQGDSASADKGKPDDSGKGKDTQDQDAKDGKESNDNKGANPNNGKPSSSQKNEGMLDKMKNALSDLAEKIKQAAEGSKGQSTPPNSSGEKHDEGQKGDQNKDQQSPAQANAEQQGAQGRKTDERRAKRPEGFATGQGSGLQERHRRSGRRKGAASRPSSSRPWERSARFWENARPRLAGK